MAKNETNAQRRERARQTAAKLREEEIKRTKRNRIIAVVAGVVVVALLAGAIWFIVSGGSNNSAGKAAGPSSSGVQSSSEITTEIPNGVNKYGGISVGKDLTAGTANEGAPRVSIYFDYLCSHCNHLEAEYAEQLATMAKNGEITLEYYPTSIYPNVPFSADGQRAEMWMANHAPDKYIDFHNRVMAEHTIPLFENPSSGGIVPPEVDKLYEVASEVGLSSAQVAQMKEDLGGGAYKELVEQLMNQFRANGFTGTPTVLINGEVLKTDWSNGGLTKAIEAAK